MYNKVDARIFYGLVALLIVLLLCNIQKIGFFVIITVLAIIMYLCILAYGYIMRRSRNYYADEYSQEEEDV